jgi:hypothetical protein
MDMGAEAKSLAYLSHGATAFTSNLACCASGVDSGNTPGGRGALLVSIIGL